MVSNTTGSCKPIHNVAYCKNASDDTQGDEMLTEFDDYFLRMPEANDIDVEIVKQKAQEQMASNRLNDLSSLLMVPDAISEPFIVTSDLAGIDYTSV